MYGTTPRKLFKQLPEGTTLYKVYLKDFISVQKELFSNDVWLEPFDLLNQLVYRDKNCAVGFYWPYPTVFTVINVPISDIHIKQVSFKEAGFAYVICLPFLKIDKEVL